MIAVVPPVELLVDELHRAPWNANKTPPATLAKIRRSLERYGLIETLVVRVRAEGGYEVISGNHRLQLLVDAGVERAPCFVVDADDAHARLLAQAMNNTRGRNDPAAFQRMLREILEELDAREITGMLNLTAGEVQRLAAIAGDEPEPDEYAGPVVHHIVIDCAGEAEQTEVIDLLLEEGVECRAVFS